MTTSSEAIGSVAGVPSVVKAKQPPRALIADGDGDQWEYGDVGTAAGGDIVNVNVNVTANAKWPRAEN